MTVPPEAYRVLVIDDDESMRRLIGIHLEHAGLEVLLAENGMRGLALAREHAQAIGAIVLDVMMPGMDGYQVLDQLHTDPVTTLIPVVFITAHANRDEDVIRGIRHGAVDHLSKPFNGQLLAEKIRVLVTRRFVDLDLRERLDEAEARAITDALTGLPNRREFETRLSREVAFAERHAQPFTLLMLDLDHFKRVNDQHGHAEGDRVLVQVGRVMREALRGSDEPYRIGGEEFAAILRNASLSAGRQVALRILEAIRAEPFRFRDGSAQVLTASIGAAAADESNDYRTQNIMDRADHALYQAKHLGRDRVEIATP
jgi:two-component system cell cycle response regulator